MVHTYTTEHDARLPDSDPLRQSIHEFGGVRHRCEIGQRERVPRSEEHTSELQSPCNIVCSLLLEKKKPSMVQGLARCGGRGGAGAASPSLSDCNSCEMRE